MLDDMQQVQYSSSVMPIIEMGSLFDNYVDDHKQIHTVEIIAILTPV